MKKALLLLALAAIALTACQKEPKAPKYPTPEPGASYVLEGTVATDGFTWNSASKIGIYGLTEGLRIMNEECKIDGWAVPVDPSTLEEGQEAPEFVPSPYEGKATARFNTPGLDLVKGENEFLVYSPYDDEMSYIPSQQKIYSLSISDSQTQPAPNVAGGCFAFGIAKGIAGKDEAFSFSLNPVTAMIKVNVSSSEFTGYGVKKITLSDDSGNAKLGGNFDVTINDMAFDTHDSFSKVATTVAATRAMAAGETQSVFINVLPGDFTSTEFTIIVELASEKGNVIIPMKKNGVKCEAGKIVEFNLTGLSSNDNIYAWYCPVENRQLVGCAYAYGDQNTYLIQSKTAVYKNGTLSPVADIPDEVTIDYRVRGDYTKAEIPDDVTFEWATMANGNIYTTRTNSLFDASSYTITPDPANYKVKVKNNAATGTAPILLMKKNGNILWGWAFWNIAADGTKLEEVTLGSHKFANMTIGEATADRAAWVASGASVWQTIYYYQWGRYLPSVFWQSYWSHGFLYCAPEQEQITNKSGNLPAVNGPFATLKEALAWPYGAITHYDASAGSSNNWTEEYIGDLWGCSVSHEETAGTKSIYDPCPKGWRVPDKLALQEIEDALGQIPDASKFETATGRIGLKAGDLFLPYVGYIDYKTIKKNSETDYRPTNYGTQGWSQGFSMYWSNYCASHTANSPYCYRFYSNSKTGTGFEAKVAQQIRASAAPVRCQKDDDNR